MNGSTMFAQVLDDGALVSAIGASERLVAAVDELVANELGFQGELLGADFTLERLVAVGPHVTAESLGSWNDRQQKNVSTKHTTSDNTISVPSLNNQQYTECCVLPSTLYKSVMIHFENSRPES